jgi:hypothetical protein
MAAFCTVHVNPNLAYWLMSILEMEQRILFTTLLNESVLADDELMDWSPNNANV